MQITLNQEEIQQAIRDFLQKNYSSHIEVIALNMIGSRSNEGYSLKVDLALDSVSYHGNVPKTKSTTEFKYEPSYKEQISESDEVIENLFNTKTEEIKEKILNEEDSLTVDAIVKNINDFLDNPTETQKSIIEECLLNCSDKQFTAIQEYPIYKKWCNYLETKETDKTSVKEEKIKEKKEEKESESLPDLNETEELPIDQQSEEIKEETPVEKKEDKPSKKLFTTPSIFS